MIELIVLLYGFCVIFCCVVQDFVCSWLVVWIWIGDIVDQVGGFDDLLYVDCVVSDSFIDVKVDIDVVIV